MTELGIGIVGLGHVAQHHIEALRHVDGTRLVAVFDIDTARSQGVPDGVEWCGSLDDLLARSNIDVIVVAAPTGEHHRIGLAVLEARKWLVLEKPAAESREQFAALAARAKASERWMSVAFHAAFGREVRWFRERVQANGLDLGPVIGFSAGFYDPYVGPLGLLRKASSLGGSWMDSGVNALSVLERFLDPSALRIIDARFTRVAALGRGEVQATVELAARLADVSISGVIDTNWTLGRNRKVTRLLYARDRVVTLDHSAQTVQMSDGDSSKLLYDGSNELSRLTNHYVGVFSDLVEQHARGEDNLALARSIHRIFYDALAAADP
jgi:D-galactose 1-dehydrogenase